MADADEFVVAIVVGSNAIAEMLADMLKDAGIPAYVPGGSLQDEWATAQKAMGLVSAEVHVPRNRLEEARKVIEEAKASADGTDIEAPVTQEAEEDPDDSEAGNGSEAEKKSAGDSNGGDATADLATESASETQAPTLTNREIWLELAVVSFVVIVPGLYWSLAEAFIGGESSAAPDTLDSYFWPILNRLIESALVLYVIFRSGETWKSFGFVKPRWIADPLTGLILLGIAWGGGKVVLSLIWELFYPETGGTAGEELLVPKTVTQFLVLGVYWLSVGFSEELIFRGYLITRLERLTKSPGETVLVSAAVFAAMHAYQGWEGVISAAFMGLFFGIVFSISQRLWPIMLAHALFNFAATMTSGSG